MKYRLKKDIIVDAFQLDGDCRRTAPEWFINLLDKDIAIIDETLIDGAVHIYGCSFYLSSERFKAKVGDYIVRLPGGELRALKPKQFAEQYELVNEQGGR